MKFNNRNTRLTPMNIILQSSLKNVKEHLPYVYQAKEFAINNKNRI